MSRVSFLLAALAFAACTDVPTGPDPSNPYDPAFAGSRQVSVPGNLSLVASTPTSITLTWADSSSFETGYRIERARVSVYNSSAFKTLAVLPPDVTTYTRTDPAEHVGYLYRVVAMGGLRDRDSAPSNVLHLQVPVRLVLLQPELSSDLSHFGEAGFVRFSEDGATLYAVTRRLASGTISIEAFDTQTGRTRWSVPGLTTLIRVLPGGRVVASSGRNSPSRIVVIGPSGEIQQETAPDIVCRVVGVSDDATRAVMNCGGNGIVIDLRTGRADGSLDLPGLSVAAVSPDGQIAIGGQYGLDVAIAYHIDQRRELWRTSACNGNGDAEISPDGTVTLFSSCSSPAYLFDTRTGAPQTATRGSEWFTFDDSGRYVYTTEDNETSRYPRFYVSRVSDGATVRSFGVPAFWNIDVLTALILPDDGAMALVLNNGYRPVIARWEPGSRWEVVTD